MLTPQFQPMRHYFVELFLLTLQTLVLKNAKNRFRQIVGKRFNFYFEVLFEMILQTFC